MSDRDHLEARPFGLRRTVDSPPAPGRECPPTNDLSQDPAPRTGVLAWALKSAALAGFSALFATQYLVRVSAPGEAPASRVTLAARGPQGEPETTGSIGRSVAGAAQATRLDPCALAGAARPRT